MKCQENHSGIGRCGHDIPEGHPKAKPHLEIKTFLVDIAVDARLPKEDQESEVRFRLMSVSGVLNVEELPS